MNLKKLKAALLVAVIFMLLPLNAVGQANTYYDKGQNGQRHTLKERMALVGHNCMVSRLPDGIEVGSGAKNLSNLCDENLDNYYALPNVVDATLLAGSPIVAVKDMKHYIDKNTKAGFKISGESNVLNLEVLKGNYHIRFYRDGVILKTSSVEQLGFTVLNLSVGNIDLGNNAVDIIAAEQPDQDYDEIALVGQDGIEVDVVKGLKIYYAFVGNAEYPLAKEHISKYNEDITLEADASDFAFKNRLIDNDLSNGVSVSLPLVSFAQVTATKTGSTKETFPKGTEAGFVFSSADLLKLGATPVITLYDKTGRKKLYSKAVETTILALSLGVDSRKISIKAPCDFSSICLTFKGVKLGATSAKYAFIIPKPITAGHRCEMSPTASLDVCNCDSHYQLKWDNKNFPNAKWEEAETLPDGVKFDSTNNTLDFSETDSYQNGSDERVTVKMKLTNTDGCSQIITINYGGSTEQKPEDKKETVLYNKDPKNPEYELGEGNNAGINILSIVKNSNNIISSKLNSYASYFGGVSIGDSYICSVKKKNGKISDGTTRQNGERQVGFVVTAKGTALSADVLKLMNVRIYNGGEQVGAGISTSAISAKLIGSQNTHKVRYYIKVPASTVFDEIRLYSSGVLGADLSVMNIYYAYTADADAILDDPMQGAEIISFEKNNASINAYRTQSIGVAQVGNGLKDITNCIDGNLETKTTFPIGINAVSGSVLAVKLGVTATRNKQLVVVVNKEAVGLGLDVAGAIVVKTYKTGVEEPIETFSDWSVLGANVITLGDKGYIFINPKDDYDEVAITEGEGIKALDGLAVYGLILRNDKDADGTPDVDEPGEQCKQDLVFEEEKYLSEKSEKNYKKKLTMYFKRSFVGGKWNSLMMPVTLTKEQFVQAFGDKAKLAKADEVREEANKLVIGFKLVDENNTLTSQDEYLIANTPYIIYMDADFVKSRMNQMYDTYDVGVIKGAIYVVDNTKVSGVNFTYDANVADGPVSSGFTVKPEITTKWPMTNLEILGSYDPHQSLADGNYIWNNGDLYRLKKAHWMKGYRCWLNPTWTNPANAALFTFGVGDGNTTGIHLPSVGNNSGSTRVYNLNGQRIHDMMGVQPGIYIVNGKKVVVK